MMSKPQETEGHALGDERTVGHGGPKTVVDAIDAEREMSVKDSFRFWPKAILFSFVISTAIIMEVGARLLFFLFLPAVTRLLIVIFRHRATIRT